MIMDYSDIEAVLFDLDGTIYYGMELIPGANETIEFFRREGKKVFFTTNNSTLARRQVYEKLMKIGVRCSLEEVLGSGYIAALYAKENKLDNIFVFGSDNLIEEFEGLGMKVADEAHAENLFIGYNPKMDYEFLTAAVNVAFKAKMIISCNKDRVFPGQNQRLMPGCGAMAASVEWCSGRESDLVVGKPNTYLADYVHKEYDIPYEKMLVVGDGYETDIAMAKNAGCRAILLSDEKHGDCVTVPDISKLI